MTPADWAGLAVSIIAVVAGFSGAVRWLVKHYLYELKPNGGGSLKDEVKQLKRDVELLTDLVKEALKR